MMMNKLTKLNSGVCRLDDLDQDVEIYSDEKEIKQRHMSIKFICIITPRECLFFGDLCFVH